jgi:hypothetical protein
MEAKLKYNPVNFEIIEDGLYVTCVVTKKKIFLEDLLYWNIERQEPYADAYASLKRELELKK